MADRLKPFIWDEITDYIGFQPKIRCEDGEVAPNGSEGFHHYFLNYGVYPEYAVDTGDIIYWETTGIYPLGISENKFKSKEAAMEACWRDHCRRLLFYFKK